MIKAIGRNLQISTKDSVEVCKFIKGQSLEKAKELLNLVIKKKIAVPVRRFSEGAGHKKEIGPGKFPVSACKEILKIVELAEANAINRQLTGQLIIKNIKANKGSKTLKYGRKRGRKTKRTHVEIIVEEKK